MEAAVAGDVDALRARIAELEGALAGALVESSPDPLLTVDVRGVVTACNRTGLCWLRRGSAEVLDRPLAVLFAPADRPAVARLVALGWAGVAERTLSLVDGRRVSLNAAASGAGDARSFHLTLRDVTHREVLDEAEDQRRRMSALADLAGALARELSDPLSIVQGRLELLLEIGETDPEMVRKHLAVALDHARRIGATLRNLRLVGQPEAPRLATVFLADVLEEARDIVGPRLRRAELAFDLEPGDLAVGGERARYARVFANLLSWLLDALPHGGALHVSARQVDDEVVAWVRGEGIGVHAAPPELHGGEGFGAHGLGLAVASTIVTAAGGRIEARRTPAGAQFTLWLPPAPGRRARPLPLRDEILLVGREELAQALRDLLARDGFAVRHLPDAECALDALAREPEVAGVATELLLDGMSGLALVEEIVRRHPRLSGRVLLLGAGHLPALPASVVPIALPLSRGAVLGALGRPIRRRRR